MGLTKSNHPMIEKNEGEIRMISENAISEKRINKTGYQQ